MVVVVVRSRHLRAHHHRTLIPHIRLALVPVVVVVVEEAHGFGQRCLSIGIVLMIVVLDGQQFAVSIAKLGANVLVG